MADESIPRDVPGGVPRQGSVSSSHVQFQGELASAETCTVMNFLGYGPYIRQARRDAYKECGRLLTAQSRDGSTWIIAGSKAEGLTSYLESDRDYISVVKGVICLEEGVDSSTIPGETNILRSCSRLSYPGHCRLLLERFGTTASIQFTEALCDDGYGRLFLSSDLYVNACSDVKHTEDVVVHERAGPSTPSTLAKDLHTDLVHALHFYCPGIVTRWATRHRNWPTPNVVQEVVSLGALVTPVGMKGSDYEHVEWRMCFNTAESVLVQNLNDTQVKLYVLLKMVKKDVLKPRKKEFTSFTMKNIVLWIAENNQQLLFHERSLIHWLHEGLDALRVAIDKRELPYYIIPERNLMAACDLDNEQQRAWIATINELIEEGPRIILRLPKIRRAIIAHPEPLRWHSGMKIEMEMLELIKMYRAALGVDMETDIIYQVAKRRQHEIASEVNLEWIMDWRSTGDLVIDLNYAYTSLLM
ncbi:uncharacterized protein LOC127881288 [Dreissena polymorpha]|uniref:Uncharacterized protein n=1 Tax=Dreissena polymorpha TaxID=45954 RepID=A0A9D4JQY5_DREPO|nr:uncharacterized protein LOC127881288 [Dreissena polymorpha]KAH3819544.1 hypothetical protein DPMN_121282 [Dreissena polymorpha]